MAGAPRVEPPVVRVAQPVDRLRSAGRLRTIRGWGAVGTPATPLQPQHGHRAPAGRRRPRGHAPQARRTRPFGCRLRDLPGPREPLRPQRARAAVLARQERVEQAPHQRDRGQEPPPWLARRFPTSGADRARWRVWRAGLRCARALAIARLPRRRRGGRDDAHPQDTPPADGGRDRDRRPRPPGPRRIGHAIGGHLLRVFDRGAEQRRAPEGQPRPRPAQGIPTADRGPGRKRPPHCRRERALSTASVRAILEGMTHEGGRGKTAPGAGHFLRRTRRSWWTAAALACKGKPGASPVGQSARGGLSLWGRDGRYGTGLSTDARYGAALVNGQEIGLLPMDGSPVPPGWAGLVSTSYAGIS